MARDKGRVDLKRDIRRAIAEAEGFDFEGLEPLDYAEHADKVLAAVLPHFELAYERGVMAERSRAGYKIPNPRKES
jgi:hypothetical protein